MAKSCADDEVDERKAGVETVEYLDQSSVGHLVEPEAQLQDREQMLHARVGR